MILRILLCLCPLAVFFLSAVSGAEMIYVKLLVDEEEPALRRLWQQRLRNRLEQASAVIQRYGDIRFTVYAYDTWNSDDRISDFSRTLREFEQEVSPKPAHLAIGFSSQYRFGRGRANLERKIRPLYAKMAKQLSQDKSAPRYIRLIDQSLFVRPSR